MVPGRPDVDLEAPDRKNLNRRAGQRNTSATRGCGLPGRVGVHSSGGCPPSCGRGQALYCAVATTAAVMDNDRVMDLLARVGKEDQAAFRELYKAFSRKVYAYVLNMLNDHARAEEVLVDAMYEVWRHPARFRGDSQFSTWLIGIARNKALMVYRARRPDEAHDDLDDVADTLAGDTPDGFAQLAAKQRSEGVQRCMGRLSDEHRECMHLVFFEGLSLAEVAQVQRCPEGTVKTRLFHARQKIKQCLQLLLGREGGVAGVAA